MKGIGGWSPPSRNTGSTLLSSSILADVMVETVIPLGVLDTKPNTIW